MRRRLQSFFYSRRNLAGLVLAFGGIALYAFGIVGAPVWLPITAGLYAVGYLLMPEKPDPGVPADPSKAEVDIRDDLTNLVHGLRGKVADDLYAKAWSIRKSIMTTLDVEGTQDASDPNVFLIRQTALAYLPDAFSTYLRLPREVAEQRPIASGRTPHDVLLDQLDLMDRRLASVADDLARHDSDALLANGRFLADKFGTSAFQLPADASAGSAVVASTVAVQTAPVPEVEHAKVDEQVAEQVAERERVH